jgi:hypothetical protein
MKLFVLLIAILTSNCIIAQDDTFINRLFLGIPLGQNVDSIISLLNRNDSINKSDVKYTDAAGSDGVPIQNCIKFQGVFYGHELIKYHTKNRLTIFCNSSSPDDNLKYTLKLDFDFNRFGKFKMFEEYKRLKKVFKKLYKMDRVGKFYGDNFMGTYVNFKVDENRHISLGFSNGDDIKDYILNVQLSIYN